MNDKIKIIIATHKKYQMPNSNIYLPVHAGKKGKNNIGYQGDDKGKNISAKNPYYCELTCLYWAWKNLEAEYIGLAHYRRHFSKKRKSHDKFNNILTEKEALKLLEKSDVILPKKRNYYIETLYNHYKHTMYIEPLEETRNIIKEQYPEYLSYFDNLKKRTSAHMFNMFIMKKEILNNYCAWLFDILEKLEKRIDKRQYDSFHARFFGRISELLLDIYLEKNNIKYIETNVIYMEKVNWFTKIASFLKAKFGGKKYEKSF